MWGHSIPPLADEPWSHMHPPEVLQPQLTLGGCQAGDSGRDTTHWEASPCDRVRGSIWAVTPEPGEVATKRGSSREPALFPGGTGCLRHSWAAEERLCRLSLSLAWAW
jgi:hypothetical protein